MTATSIAAFWGLGYSALMIANLIYGWPDLDRRPRMVIGDGLAVAATLLMWLALIARAAIGHGWPFVSPTDRAAGIAVGVLSISLAWKWASGDRSGQLIVGCGSVLLLSYALGRYPQGAVTSHIVSTGVVIGGALNLLGGSLLALAAAISLGNLARGMPQIMRRLGLTSRPRSSDLAADNTSENLVRGALFCLAVSLAIDTWWLQKVGLGSPGDAQQAGIAVAWMIYFVALRLRDNPRWRGWPWAAVLAVGFVCTLPILIQASWLEATLHV